MSIINMKAISLTHLIIHTKCVATLSRACNDFIISRFSQQQMENTVATGATTNPRVSNLKKAKILFITRWKSKQVITFVAELENVVFKDTHQ